MRHDHHAPKSAFPGFRPVFPGLLLAATAGAASAAPAPGTPRELGLWYNDSGKGAVEIRPCADTGRDANYLCGFIVWLKEPNNKKGEPLTDGYNADPEKRTPPDLRPARARARCGPCPTAAGTRAGSTTPSRANPSTPPSSFARPTVSF